VLQLSGSLIVRGDGGLRSKRSWILILLAISAICLGLDNQIQSAYAADLDPNDRIAYVEDGPISKEVGLPTYEWLPKDSQPIGSLLAIHGLTLHGKRFAVVCKAFATFGFYACSFDMRGFGRCYADKQHTFCAPSDCKKHVNYGKSYAEVVKLATLIKKRYPDKPLYVMGESLGTCLCVKLAAEHPQLVDGLILSSPTVKLNPLIFVHPKVIAASTFGYFTEPRFQASTDAFVKHLVSNDPDIVNEMLADPLCRKGLNFRELFKTDSFVSKTLFYAHKIGGNEPVLMIQGSEDKCMVPRAITELAASIPSSDQTLRWLHAHGHILLETAYLRPATIDAIVTWLYQHNAEHVQRAKSIEADLLKLGAKPCNDSP
jgi:acylglycerol lipase